MIAAAWASFAVSFLTLIVLYFTLRKVRDYVAETREIKKAAVEQAEAVQKPCVVLLGEQAEGLPSAMQAAWRKVVEGKAESEAAYGLKLAGEPRFRNIGSGPALKIRVTVEKIEEGKWIQAYPSGEVGYVEPGKDFALALLREWAFPADDDIQYRVTVIYESLSGQGYATSQKIEDRWLLDFSFRSNS